jgi:hypothetical protein
MGPFTEAELRTLGGDGSQERQPIPEDRAPVNDGLPHHEFVVSEFAPESGRCDKCGGGPLAPIHLKPVDQMERIANALEGILEVLTQRNDWEAERRESAISVLHDFVPQQSNMSLCQFCGRGKGDGKHWNVGAM